MATEFTMPKLGLTMEEGTIVEWLVAAETTVAPGSAVLVIDTDKTQTEVEIPDGGRLVLVGEVGETYKCGEVIGYLLAEGETAPVAGRPGIATAPGAQPSGAQSSGAENAGGSTVGPLASVALAPTTGAAIDATGRVMASPYARVRAKDLGVDILAVRGSGPGGRVVATDIESAATARRSVAVVASVAAQAEVPAPSVPEPGAPVASVLTGRRGAMPAVTFAGAELARLVGLDLTEHAIRATSPDGRISREDVATYVRTLLATNRTATARSATPPPASQNPTEIVALKGMRGTIATRMRASLQDMAQLTLMMDVDMDPVVADRSARKSAGGATPSFTDYVIAASARALRDHPRVNSQITPDGIALLPRVNVGMAVALDEGLVVPVVPDTDQLGIAELSTHTARLAEAARANKLKLSDLEGGTFSVSTLGMFGVDGFTPVINPPNAAILGVGRLRDDVAWSADGAIRRVKRLTLSLTWDHRVFDGAPAAEFVRTITRYLDDPSTLD